jgi:hypothetical protein
MLEQAEAYESNWAKSRRKRACQHQAGVIRLIMVDWLGVRVISGVWLGWMAAAGWREAGQGPCCCRQALACLRIATTARSPLSISHVCR